MTKRHGKLARWLSSGLWPAGFLLTATLSATAHAQDAWPARAIRLIIGFPPGGAMDSLARAMSTPMSKALGQSVIVENRPGAAQVLAAELVAKAEPDGYSIGLVDSFYAHHLAALQGGALRCE